MAFMNYIGLIRSYTRYLFYAILHSFYSGYGQTFLIALFVPAIRNSFNLGLTEFSSFYSAATLFSAAMLPYTGRLIDDMHLRRYSMITGLFLLLSMLSISLAQNLFLLFVGLVLLRHTGQSLMGHIASTAMARYFGKLRGKALGLSSLGHPLGEAILPIFVAQLLLMVGWRHTFLTLTAIFVITFFPGLLAIPKADDPFLIPPQKKDDKINLEETHLSRRDVLTTPFFYFVMPMAVVPPFFATAFFFHQAVLAEFKGWTLQWIAACFVGFAIFRVLGSFTIGPAIDRFSARKIYPYHLIPMILGLVLLTLGTHKLICLAYLSLFGMSIGFEFNIKTALWAEVYGTKHLGAIKSMALTIVIFSTAISPVLFGWLLERGYDFNNLILVSAGITAISSVLAGIAPVPRKT